MEARNKLTGEWHFNRMNPLELNITSLAELTSQQLHVKNNSLGKKN